MKPIKTIQLGYNYDEDYQMIEETHEITLDNGWDVIFTYTAEVYVINDRGITYYEEDQFSVDIENQEIEIIELWDGEEPVYLDEIQEKELKQNILNSIE